MKKILVIEDNELNMKLFCDILAYNNYDVDKAYNGVDGLSKIKENKYDLILLDIQLPKLSGFDILENLKKAGIQTPPTIIISAFASDKDKLIAANYGINSYLTKPIDINSFLGTVKYALKES